jgi:hypothetical protein
LCAPWLFRLSHHGRVSMGWMGIFFLDQGSRNRWDYSGKLHHGE